MKYLKQDQIISEFGDQVESGKVVIVEVNPTKNPEFQSLGFAQKVDLPNPTEVSDIQKALLGWNDTRESIIRAWHNFRVRKDSEGNLISYKPGEVLEGFTLRVREDCTPEDRGQDVNGETIWQSPKIYPESHDNAGETIKTKDGQPIYRHVDILSYKEFTKSGGHKVLSSNDPAPKEEGVDLLEEMAKASTETAEV